MRVLKWALSLTVLLVLAFLSIAMLLPREVTVVRSVEINAPADQVFPHVNSLKATEAWSPWMDRDPDVQTNYSGPDVGVGAKLEWASEHPQVGNGSQEIMVSVLNEKVETALDFGDMGTAKAQFLLSEQDGLTSVTWTLLTDTGNNPIGRWMGVMLDDLVGPDYETGLSNLKSLVEG